ncbi:MFS transporter [Caballeronia insecticola]|uniref:Major facilitator superfamily MFS_1 n=1 Tax=Caballeronia insecticola TaxID=758793 RepID=R4WSL5_9BURK|nr:MFS transporter [Caballeronia insecticola]BAN27628.1 major facilitator superfamily MFS_1 [Caballeronia insecticola]
MTLDTTPVQRKRLDLRDTLQAAPLGAFHFRLAILLALILWYDGFDLYNASYIVHDVAPAWHLSPSQIGLLLSCGLGGFAIGSAVSGLFGDRFGRRRVILPGVWISSVMSLAIALFAHDLDSFVALRIVMGIALGLLMPMCVTYINEIAPKRSNNVFTIGFFSLGWIGGATSSGFIAAWLMPRFGWQSMYYTGALAMVLAVALQFVLPESVAFLGSRNRQDDVRAQLARFWPARAAEFRDAELVVPAPTVKAGSFRALFAARFRRQTLCFWAMGALSLFSSYGLSGWLPTILLKRGENLSSSFAYGSLLVFASAFGSLLSGFMADRIGNRRLAMSIAWLLGASAIAMLAVMTGGQLFWVIAMAGMFVIGTQTVLNNLVAVSYPTEIRSTGVGVFFGIARFGAMCGPAISGVLQQATGGPGAMFVVLGGALVTAAALVFLVERPENLPDAPAFGH